MIIFGSLCSGIEAASVASAPLGWQAGWFSEVDPFACTLLAHHYPQVSNHGNMLDIPRLQRTGIVRAVDVLLGGTPCQAFSVAGLRASLDDDRGNLSLTFCEIADENDLQRQAAGLLPAVILWENVPGVLSTKDNAFGCFLARLAGETCPLVAPGGKWPNAGVVVGPKRTVAWRVTDAQYFGVAQRRRRVFVVASARQGFDPAAILFEFDGMRRDTAPRRETGQDPAGTLASRTDGGGFPGTDEACSGYVQPICPTLRAGGNRIGGDRPPGTDVDTADSLIALSVALRGRDGGATAELGDEVAGCLRASTGGGDKPHVLAPIAFDCKASGQSGFGVGEIASTMRAMGHANSHQNGGGHLAVAYKKPLPGESGNDYWQRMSDYEREHGIDPSAGSDPFPTPVCVTGEVTHTLKAEGFDASEDGTGRGQPIVAAYSTKLHNTKSNGAGKLYPEYTASLDANSPPPALLTAMAVRRLTPVECERLQGFPDGYTDIPVRGKPAADGPRYKALGNSWAVPNVRWIMRRIDAQLRALEGAC